MMTLPKARLPETLVGAVVWLQPALLERFLRQQGLATILRLGAVLHPLPEDPVCVEEGSPRAQPVCPSPAHVI